MNDVADLHLVRAPDAVADAPGSPAVCAPAKKPRKKRPKWRPRPQPFDRLGLDRRTRAAMIFDKLVADILRDLGGADQVGTIELGIVETFAGAYLGVKGFNNAIVTGQDVDWEKFSGVASTAIRAASRLQPWRRSKDITPSLSDLLKGSPP
jgi:hypothetical protein